MAILNKLISAAVMTIVLTGCYSDFEPDIDSTPVVCINANAKVGEVLKYSPQEHGDGRKSIRMKAPTYN